MLNNSQTASTRHALGTSSSYVQVHVRRHRRGHQRSPEVTADRRRPLSSLLGVPHSRSARFPEPGRSSAPVVGVIMPP